MAVSCSVHRPCFSCKVSLLSGAQGGLGARVRGCRRDLGYSVPLEEPGAPTPGSCLGLQGGRPATSGPLRHPSMCHLPPALLILLKLSSRVFVAASSRIPLVPVCLYCVCSFRWVREGRGESGVCLPSCFPGTETPILC